MNDGRGGEVFSLIAPPSSPMARKFSTTRCLLLEYDCSSDVVLRVASKASAGADTNVVFQLEHRAPDDDVVQVAPLLPRLGTGIDPTKLVMLEIVLKGNTYRA
jgi:hypothetical protein